MTVLHGKSAGVSLCVFALAVACGEEATRPVEILLPDPAGDLERADNASFRIAPDGPSAQFAIDGLDFAVDLNIGDYEGVGHAEFFLAEDQRLLAWGRSVNFAPADGDRAPALLLLRPGQLSSIPSPATLTTEGQLAARLGQLGVLTMDARGDAYFTDFKHFEVVTAAVFPAAVPASDDGLLVTGPGNTALRVTWNEAFTAWGYDPSADTWQPFGFSDALAPRPGATPLPTDDGEVLYLFGGGGQTDVLAISLRPDGNGHLPVAIAPDWHLPHARVNATAAWLTVPGVGDTPILFGGQAWGATAGGTATVQIPPVLSSVNIPVELTQPTGLADLTAWTQAACEQLQSSEAAATSGGPRAKLICLGGRDGAGLARSDAVVVAFHGGGDAGGAPTLRVQDLMGYLPAAIAAPRLFSDASAIYAEGDGQWLRIDRSSRGVAPTPSEVHRAAGGHVVEAPTGASLLIGGLDRDGNPIATWRGFMPPPEAL